jgi:hypothetical protein
MINDLQDPGDSSQYSDYGATEHNLAYHMETRTQANEQLTYPYMSGISCLKFIFNDTPINIYSYQITLTFDEDRVADGLAAAGITINPNTSQSEAFNPSSSTWGKFITFCNYINLESKFSLSDYTDSDGTEWVSAIDYNHHPISCTLGNQDSTSYKGRQLHMGIISDMGSTRLDHSHA